jgi:4-diphosphocytidyl-2-C-methyl-D-erythritol kinase
MRSGRAWRAGSSGQVPVILRAPAKINLSLRVTARRTDGYHELLTRMQKLDLGDRIEVLLTERPGIVCRCDDPNLPSDRNNLAAKAAESFLQAVGWLGSYGVQVSISKRIPVAAGLGGGSSDAGTVLRGLNALQQTPFSQEELIDLARPLGADVPFFVHRASAAIATGIGDRLQETAALEGFFVLLVNPGFAVSTKAVFENYALTIAGKKSTIRGSHVDEGGVFTPERLHNDLEQITIAWHPVIGEIKRALLKAGAVGALMSGSGPTVFGLFDEHHYSKESLKTVAELIAAEYGGRVFLTKADAGA